MDIKKICISLTLLCASSNIFAFEKLKLEFGIGSEYGGLGTQIYLPISSKAFQTYITVGYLGLDTDKDNSFFASGAGVNFRINRKSNWGIYSGILDTGSSIDVNNGFINKTDTNFYGVSINYKYNLFRSNFKVGASFNIHEEGNYPMVSVSYQY